jgi:hypothetical protein
MQEIKHVMEKANQYVQPRRYNEVLVMAFVMVKTILGLMFISYQGWREDYDCTCEGRSITDLGEEIDADGFWSTKKRIV